MNTYYQRKLLKGLSKIYFQMQLSQVLVMYISNTVLPNVLKTMSSITAPGGNTKKKRSSFPSNATETTQDWVGAFVC